MTRIPAVDPERRQGRVALLLHRFGMSRAGRWYGIKVGSRVDPWLLKMTRGRFATTAFFPLLLLRVPGRRSGELRTVTLVYFTHGDEVVLVASSFGRPANPAWYLNLMAAGEAELSAGGVTVRARPREVEGEEHRRLLDLAANNYAGYGIYEEMATGRTIPVVALREV